MQRKFLTSLFLIVLLNLLVKPFYILGIDAEVQNRVGEDVYGNYFSLLNFSFLLNILLDLGITNYNTRNIAQHPQLLRKHFFRILSLRFLLFLLYAAMTMLSGVLVGYSHYEMYLLLILLVNQFFVAIVQFSRSNFAGLHLFKTDAVISVLDRSLLIIFCSLLLWGNVLGTDFQIEWFIYAQSLAYGLSALISVVLLSSKVGSFKLQIKKTFSIAILKQSFPYALLIFLMMMYNRIDAVMLERMLVHGDAQAGMYAQGFRILDAVNMFALLFAGLLLPIFARLIKEKGDVRGMMELALRILLVFSITVGIFGFAYRESLLDLRYPNVDPDATAAFGWLILTFIPVSITYVFGTLLTANGSLKQLNWMALFGVVFNVLLNIYFINRFKVEGASIATLTTQIVTALIQVVLVYRILKLKINYGLFLRIFLFAILVAAFIQVLTYLDFERRGVLELLTFAVLCPAAAFALKLIRVSDFKSLLKRSVSKEDQSQ